MAVALPGGAGPLYAAVLTLVTVGCGPGGGGSGGPTPEENLAMTEAMFQRLEIVEVAIEMDPADWDALRFQTRSILDVVGSTCLEPPQRPFTYFPATVMVNGERVEEVAVRKKGFFGSLDEVKPSLKIKFDEYVPEQRVSGLSRMTLNNNKSDPSHVKQCLGYEMFAAAGIASPRCNFARVSVNGKGLGIFTHVESIKRQFLRRNFADNDGDLFEGALSDFRPGWVGTFQRKTHRWLDAEETVPNEDTSLLEAMVPVMELPDSELLDGLSPHVDVEHFLDYWVMETLIGHADGYARNTNNFYLYFDPTTGLANFIPWGIDSIFHAGQFALPWEENAPPLMVWDEGVLAKRLYQHPTTQPQYFARMQTMLDAVWDEALYLNRIDEYEALLSPFVVDARRADFEGVLARVRSFLSNRRGQLEAAMAQAPPASRETLRDPWCVDVLGTVDATFSTRWGTLPEDDVFATGLGTLELDPAVGLSLPAPDRVGSKAGYDERERQNVIQVVGWYDPNIAVILHLTISDPADLVPGAVLDIDWLESAGYLVRIEFVAGSDPEFQVLGMVGDGTLTLEEAGTDEGDLVSGTLSSLVYEPIF